MTSRRLIYVIYALSGAAGLVYEVAWTRLLGLHLGSTTAAVSTVLASYMGGMAIGSIAGGHRASALSPAGALRAYAALEAGIGAYALLLPWLLAVAEPLLGQAYAGGGGGTAFAAVRLGVSLLIVTPPAVAMGATFPVATRAVLTTAGRAGAEVGGLYAANTLGAASGALAAGFVLLPALGLTRTTIVGVVLNALASGGGLWLARFAALPRSDLPRPGEVAGVSCPARKARNSPPGRVPIKARRPILPGSPGLARPGLAAAALGVSGFVGLAYEVVWTRVLALVIGPTSYAFSAMLAAFIGGLALGSLAGARIAGRTRQPMAWLTGTLLLTMTGAAAVGPVVNRLPLAVAAATAAPGATLEAIVIGQSAFVALVLLPLTLALGAMFPLGMAVATRSVEHGPRDVALVYALNTAGAIAGSLLAGFVFVPRFGLHGTGLVAAAAALAAAMAVATFGLKTTRQRTAAALVGLASFAGVATMPGLDRELLTAGAYKYAPYVARLDLESALKAGTLLFHADGAAGTVTVRRVAGITMLAIDGKVDASNGGDMLTQTLLGHLPLLLHDEPRRVCVIGLGSGVTVGAVLAHPVEEVDVLEISPEVVRASDFFVAENGRALADPRTRLIVGDGRTHLSLGRRSYDVVISEPSNPWMSGMAALFTREFFQAARRRLSQDGLFCQWAHTYDMSDADLRSIVGTFTDVFPGATLWLVGEGDVLLVGGTGPADSRLAGVAANLERPGVGGDLEAVALRDAFSLLSMYVAGGRALAAYAADAARQTDDRLALEYSAPRAIYGRSTNENLERLLRLADPAAMPESVRSAIAGATAGAWANRGRMLLAAEAYTLAYESVRRAFEFEPVPPDTFDLLERAAGASGRVADAVDRLREMAAARPASVPVRLGLSRLLAAEGRVEAALVWAREARDLAPEAFEPVEQLASVLADSGDVGGLEAAVSEMATRWAQEPGTRYFTATLRFLRGEFAAAADLAESAGTADPRHARAWSVAGAARASLGQVDSARSAFARSLSIDPRSAATYANLALLEMSGGNLERAARVFAEALTVDPAYGPALAGLAQVLDQQGHAGRAARLRARAAEIDAGR